MLRSRGKKSLDLCGFQSAEPDKQGKDTFPLKFRVLLRNKSTAKELISYGSFQSGTQHGIYRNEQPPLTQQGADLKSKGLVVANALTSRRLGLIGGSGSGKTRFFVKPNLMQMHSSYVVTDPKGTVLVECGKLLQRGGYKIKVLNTINFKKSMRYNPFAYIRSEKDILKLVNTIWPVGCQRHRCL